MKILVAPDSFKGSLTALEVAENIKKGILAYNSEQDVDLLPLADGGEGTVQALVDATEGKIITEQVTGPAGNQVKAEFGILGDNKTAVIEMAAASGLPLLAKSDQNPLWTTTYGTGELISAALTHQVEKIIIGIGGSATNDAGAGMAQALGAKLLDKKGEEIGFGGGNLNQLAEIDLSSLDPALAEVEILVACDVDNPLFGKQGAAYVYGPQKGADQAAVKILDQNLRHFNRLVKKQFGKDLNKIAGAGAAGGLGAGLVAFLGAELKPGIDIVFEQIDFESRLQEIDLIFTGEGQLDGQSIHGKTPVGVARQAKLHKIPVIAIAGTVAEDAAAVLEVGITAYFSIINQPAQFEEIKQYTPALIESLAAQIMRTVNIRNEFKLN